MNSNLFISKNNSALSKLGRLLDSEAYKDAKYFIVVDENTYNCCLPMLVGKVDALERAEFFEVPVGEEAKSLEIASQLWQTLIDCGADRDSVIINLGGGCVCDLGGFVASGFMRGIRYINVPTTLISMADAAIGGKTAVNLENVKNPVGFFSMPQAVCIVPGFLSTLPDMEWLAGLFEVIKTLLLSDSVLFNEMISVVSSPDCFDEKKIWPFVSHCAEFKSNVVMADPREQSIRKILNFGHTLGHGIESFCLEEGKPLPHGVCIGLGLIGELYLSVKKLNLSRKVLDDYCRIVRGMIEIKSLSLHDTESVMKYIRRDKKNRDGLILCSLIKDVGVPIIDVVVNENEVRDALLQIGKL